MSLIKSLLPPLILIFLVLSRPAHATDNNSGYWIGVFPHYKLTEKSSLSLQAEFRHIGETSFGLWRPAFHYNFGENWNLGVGYDVFTTQNTEQRPWFEGNMFFKVLSLGQKFHFRARHETRFISNSSEAAYRTRVLALSSFRISNSLPLDGIIFDEYFYNEKTFSGKTNDYDRNWLGGRLKFNPEEQIFYEIGAFWENINNSVNSNGMVSTLSVGGKF